MTTTTGVFGHAIGLCAQVTNPGVGAGLDHLGAIRRHLQGILVQGGKGAATTSSLINITASRMQQFNTPVRTSARPRSGGTAVSEEKVLIADVRTEIPEARAGQADNDQVRTAAQDLVERVRARSGLTLEEVAPLLQISRRALQKWRAGAAISAVNERRLRDLAEAMERIAMDDNAQFTRRRLLDREPGSVRAYDLLAEARYDAAVALATGVKGKSQYTPNPDGLREDIAARLLPVPDIQPLSVGTRSTRSLRRNGK